MRGTDQQQFLIFSYISAERRVPKEDQLRAIREMPDAGLTVWGATSMRLTPTVSVPPLARERRLTIGH
jgi:hypothetical protein